MRHGRRDSTHRAIKAALVSVGATVCDTADLGGGFPDLVVGYKGRTYLLEVKGPRGRLEASQDAFRLRWRGGPLNVVRTRGEALDVLGVRGVPDFVLDV